MIHPSPTSPPGIADRRANVERPVVQIYNPGSDHFREEILLISTVSPSDAATGPKSQRKHGKMRVSS